MDAAEIALKEPPRACPCCTAKDVPEDADCFCPEWCPEQQEPRKASTEHLPGTCRPGSLCKIEKVGGPRCLYECDKPAPARLEQIRLDWKAEREAEAAPDPTARPEHVLCIPHCHADHKGRAWCGRWIGGQLTFTGIDHASSAAYSKNRYLACSGCVAAVTRTLSDGAEVQAPTVAAPAPDLSAGDVAVLRPVLDQLEDARSRLREAAQLWQAAHGKRPDEWPDFRELVGWLLARYDALSADVLRLRDEVRSMGLLDATPPVSEPAALPAWLKSGEPVWYSPDSLRKAQYLGVVDGEPRKCGDTWVVSLSNMEASYKDGRGRVPAAAIEALEPAGTLNAAERDDLKHHLEVEHRVAMRHADDVVSLRAELAMVTAERDELQAGNAKAMELLGATQERERALTTERNVLKAFNAAATAERDAALALALRTGGSLAAREAEVRDLRLTVERLCVQLDSAVDLIHDSGLDCDSKAPKADCEEGCSDVLGIIAEARAALTPKETP
jgi:hypothetical protein